MPIQFALDPFRVEATAWIPPKQTGLYAQRVVRAFSGLFRHTVHILTYDVSALHTRDSATCNFEDLLNTPIVILGSNIERCTRHGAASEYLPCLVRHTGYQLQY